MSTQAVPIAGKGYAQQLAKRGLNIVLVSRTPSKLQAVAKEIQEQYRVKTKVIAIDFTSTPDVYDKVQSETQVILCPNLTLMKFGEM